MLTKPQVRYTYKLSNGSYIHTYLTTINCSSATITMMKGELTHGLKFLKVGILKGDKPSSLYSCLTYMMKGASGWKTTLHTNKRKLRKKRFQQLFCHMLSLRYICSTTGLCMSVWLLKADFFKALEHNSTLWEIISTCIKYFNFLFFQLIFHWSHLLHFLYLQSCNEMLNHGWGW